MVTSLYDRKTKENKRKISLEIHLYKKKRNWSDDFRNINDLFLEVISTFPLEFIPISLIGRSHAIMGFNKSLESTDS